MLLGLAERIRPGETDFSFLKMDWATKLVGGFDGIILPIGRAEFARVF
jgi:hypothetical protein